MSVLNRNTKYPWEDWEDGKEHTITWQEDFKCNPSSMVALLHQRAKLKSHLSFVSTSMNGMSITFQYTLEEKTC